MQIAAHGVHTTGFCHLDPASLRAEGRFFDTLAANFSVFNASQQVLDLWVSATVGWYDGVCGLLVGVLERGGIIEQLPPATGRGVRLLLPYDLMPFEFFGASVLDLEISVETPDRTGIYNRYIFRDAVVLVPA